MVAGEGSAVGESGAAHVTSCGEGTLECGDGGRGGGGAAPQC